MQDSQPVGTRAGEPRHLLQKNDSGNGDIWVAPNRGFAAKDPKNVFMAENAEDEVGRLPGCGEVSEPGLDFRSELGVVSYQTEMLETKGVVGRRRVAGLRRWRGGSNVLGCPYG